MYVPVHLCPIHLITIWLRRYQDGADTFADASLKVSAWHTRMKVALVAQVIWIGWEILALTRKGVQNSFCFFFVRFCFFLLSFLVPFALYLQQFGTRTYHFCMVFATSFWHGNFAFCVLFATFGHVRVPFGMVFATSWHFNLSFWYFKRSCGFLEGFFRLSCRVSFRGDHLGFL